MKTHRTRPFRANSPSTAAVAVLAVIALIAVVAIGVYVVVNFNEVFGFLTYLRLAYGGWG